MTLIKFYSPTTCYDGRRAFSKPSSDSKHLKRHYPDEYLIAQILENYKNQRTIDNREIIVVSEPWGGSGDPSIGNGESRKDERPKHQIERSFDEGCGNTKAIIKRVLYDVTYPESSPLEDNEKKEQQESTKTLILVPFLTYDYHHPGIVIDVSNKHVLYLDPFGQSAHDRNEYGSYHVPVDLEKTLTLQGFRFTVVKTRQQSDSTSCGPILAASMIQFCEDFFKTGTVSPDVFTPPRLNLATDRIFQIYVNNSSEPKKSKRKLVEEIMLADADLWKEFCTQQQVGDLTETLRNLVSLEEGYIQGLKDDWETDPDSPFKKKMELIRDVQSRIIELIFLKPKEFKQDVAALVSSLSFILDNSSKEIPKLPQSRQNLLSPLHIERTKKVLGLTENKSSKKFPQSQFFSNSKGGEKSPPVSAPKPPDIHELASTSKPQAIHKLASTPKPSATHKWAKGVAWGGYSAAGVAVGAYIIAKAFYSDATDAFLSRQGLGKLSVAETNLIMLAIVLTVATVALAVSCHTRPNASSLAQRS